MTFLDLLGPFHVMGKTLNHFIERLVALHRFAVTIEQLLLVEVEYLCDMRQSPVLDNLTYLVFLQLY